jgi:membrane protein required for colicin V production
LAALTLFGVFGYASGAIKQLSHWAGVALAYLAARPAAAALAPSAAKRLDWPPALIAVILSSVLFVLFLAVGAASSRFLLARLFGDRQNGPADRAVGSVLGFGKAAAVAFALLSALLFFEGQDAQAVRAFDAATKDSAAVAFVRRHNLFASLNAPALAGIQKMIAAAKDPQAARQLAESPEFKALLEDPRVKAAIGDGALERAVRAQGGGELLNDPRVKELLNDPNLAQRLTRLQEDPAAKSNP